MNRMTLAPKTKMATTTIITASTIMPSTSLFSGLDIQSDHEDRDFHCDEQTDNDQDKLSEGLHVDSFQKPKPLAGLLV